ncbi:MAG TPA: DUF4410 domain-containing protein [Thermoanaerobaculia bacterium]|nr:DUF4410 domain-containing protein [Thermoanaerobaculia bacterium]
MRLRATALAFVLCLFAFTAVAREDLYIKSTFKGLTYYGTFEKGVPIAIGKVVDRRSVADRRFLGKGPNGIYEIFSQDPPETYVKAALQDSLESLGLAAREGESPALTVNAEIWRAHLWVRMGARARLRGEIHVRFLLERGGEPAGTVSVIGNSEIKGQVVTKARWNALFEATVYNLMEKFAASETLTKALPAEVTASVKKSATPKPEKYNAAEIEAIFYGPTELVGKLPKVDLTGYDVVEIRDFKLTDTNFKGDVTATQKMVPGAVMDRIGGRYPTLFRGATFGDTTVGDPSKGKKLVIEGDLPQVAAGSFMRRSLIGFGAGRVQLSMNVKLVDGESGKELATLEMKSLNWGAGWQTDEGELEDMVDRMAADLAYYLVNQHNPKYKTEEEEIR